ncbi:MULTISPECIES: DNA gyrase inhibitor YacG [Thiorhodovibrio]|uniref:DNA gyrase inhibitor YacG n=1 Tax=Thiorhodovibrio TaxID=61593 RepID=UPI001914290A|nr:DNA gyrase inhibitor YacG [Thiorhodovibrio litoralis]MBK5969605.1 DNA gyrase inhibitor YacG [Thiorhodovibrio winogradskyi]
MTVPCPTCGKDVVWSPDSRWRPFCSARCRLIDLGDWLDEAHRIPGDPGTPDEIADEETQTRQH